MGRQKILFEFDDFCKELGIEYCLGQGTCLGLYRDGKFIPKDSDIDVMVNCDKEKLRMLFDKLKERGYSDEEGKGFINILSKDSFEANQHFKKKDEKGNDVMLDILFNFDNKRKKFQEKFDKIKYQEREFNLPHPVEEYLELEFGENWRKPSDLKSRGMGSKHPYLTGKAFKFDIVNWFRHAK